MKTNHIMVRNNPSFIQRTSDSYFNANALLESWNKKSNTKAIQLGNYKKSGATIEFVEQLKKEGVESPMITTRGGNSGTWMHPKLFIDFAMYVSTEFKSIVIDYVLDGLINSRNDAGDYYNEMCAAILTRHVEYYNTRPKPIIFINEAILIKSILGLKKTERNVMTEKQLNTITQLQKLNTLLINKGVGKASRIKQLELQAELQTI